jgi:hypothetical protein
MIQHTYELISILKDKEGIECEGLVKNCQSYEVLIELLKKLIDKHNNGESINDDTEFETKGYEIRGYFVTIPHDPIKHYDCFYTIMRYML